MLISLSEMRNECGVKDISRVVGHNMSACVSLSPEPLTSEKLELDQQRVRRPNSVSQIKHDSLKI